MNSREDFESKSPHSMLPSSPQYTEPLTFQNRNGQCISVLIKRA